MTGNIRYKITDEAVYLWDVPYDISFFILNGGRLVEWKGRNGKKEEINLVLKKEGDKKL